MRACPLEGREVTGNFGHVLALDAFLERRDSAVHLAHGEAFQELFAGIEAGAESSARAHSNR